MKKAFAFGSFTGKWRESCFYKIKGESRGFFIEAALLFLSMLHTVTLTDEPMAKKLGNPFSVLYVGFPAGTI